MSYSKICPGCGNDWETDGHAADCGRLYGKAADDVETLAQYLYIAIAMPSERATRLAKRAAYSMPPEDIRIAQAIAEDRARR